MIPPPRKETQIPVWRQTQRCVPQKSSQETHPKDTGPQAGGSPTGQAVDAEVSTASAVTASPKSEAPDLLSPSRSPQRLPTRTRRKSPPKRSARSPPRLSRKDTKDQYNLKQRSHVAQLRSPSRSKSPRRAGSPSKSRSKTSPRSSSAPTGKDLSPHSSPVYPQIEDGRTARFDPCANSFTSAKSPTSPQLNSKEFQPCQKGDNDFGVGSWMESCGNWADEVECKARDAERQNANVCCQAVVVDSLPSVAENPAWSLSVNVGSTTATATEATRAPSNTANTGAPPMYDYSREMAKEDKLSPSWRRRPTQNTDRDWELSYQDAWNCGYREGHTAGLAAGQENFEEAFCDGYEAGRSHAENSFDTFRKRALDDLARLRWRPDDVDEPINGFGNGPGCGSGFSGGRGPFRGSLHDWRYRNS